MALDPNVVRNLSQALCGFFNEQQIIALTTALDQIENNVPAATAGTKGCVKQAATVANATVAADGTSVGTQFNALLTSLRNAGTIA